MWNSYAGKRNKEPKIFISFFKNRAVIVAPEARDERMQVIWDKMVARAELLSRPQRFSGSRALTRREMEIEKALFHGTDRSNFLTALYHQGGKQKEDVCLERDRSPLFKRFLMYNMMSVR